MDDDAKRVRIDRETYHKIVLAAKEIEKKTGGQFFEVGNGFMTIDKKSRINFLVRIMCKHLGEAPQKDKL